MQAPMQLTPAGKSGIAEYGQAMALSADGNTAAIGGPWDNAGTGAVWVFTRKTQADGSPGPWSQQGAKLTAQGEIGATPQFGYSIALSWDGNILLVGSWATNNFVGSAQLFERKDGVWSQQAFFRPPGPDQAVFGASVALSMDGQFALFGAPGANGKRGAAWIYNKTITTSGGVQWDSRMLSATDTGIQRFGVSVALSADAEVALIGTVGAPNPKGAAWSFNRTSDSAPDAPDWTQPGVKLPQPSDQPPGNMGLGVSVALSADGAVALVGSAGNNQNGTDSGAWVFTNEDGHGWTQQGGKLFANGYVFGGKVALSADGETALIGDWNDQFGGVGFVFTLQGSAWAQQGAMLNGPRTGGMQGYSMGNSVALAPDGNTFLVCGYDQNVDAPASSFDDADEEITHIFVLMLENHSFDNIFGLSRISGIMTKAPGATNTYPAGTTVPVAKPALPIMPTDPAHEFADIMEQLCGSAAQKQWVNGTPYPQVDNSGFLSNYAVSTTEIHSGNPRIPTEAERPEILKCFDTPVQLPVLYQLATTYALCDQWFASLPGPTFPNRAFLHGGSSSGLADSPADWQPAVWQVHGFAHANGHIFSALQARGKVWKIFVDPPTSIEHWMPPPVCLLKGIHYPMTYSFNDFARSVANPNYAEGYTFIEPNYGEVLTQSFKNGSAMHPMDGVNGGETLIKKTYEAIRNSPHWANSLLIITYDEHGGFYDSLPPLPAQPPNDRADYTRDTHFDFKLYGVRVPAIIISPRITRGTIDHTVYDHTSVLATIERNFGMSNLTDRDKVAKDVRHLIGDTIRPDSDCPTTLNNPVPIARAERDQDSAPLSPAVERRTLASEGTMRGFLATVAKTDLELSGGGAAELARINLTMAGLKTVAQARAYVMQVGQKAEAARAANVAR